MLFKDIQIGDYFAIEGCGELLPFEKIELIQHPQNPSFTKFPNYEAAKWNCRSLIRGSCHMMYCTPELDVQPIDKDGFF